MKSIRGLLLLCCLALPWLGQAAPPSSNVDWLTAAADADVERAFAAARKANKPLLLYWGASWCPPCNQLKATLFNRPDFVAASKGFVAVHVDGDQPGAQKLGSRFKVSGYPTMVLFSPAGGEITRLPGEVDAEQVMGLLRLGMAGGRPVLAVLADARSGKPLSAAEWRLLAFYSWGIDEQRLVDPGDVPALLAQLAVAGDGAAEPEVASRLWLAALAASNGGQGLKADAALRDRVERVLSDAARSRRQMDVLVAGAGEIVRALSDEESPERDALVRLYDAALRKLQGDATLSRGDRIGALGARVELARLETPRSAPKVVLPTALVDEVRAYVARDDAELSDPYERQAVIPAGAHVLARAGLWDDSDALLRRNLSRSHSPYYLMTQLAVNARRQGHTDQALDWYAQAWTTSVGAATRLQWGASYLGALIELTPKDAARIEKTAARVFDEAGRDPASFEGRSERTLQALSRRLNTWNAGDQHPAVMQRLRTQLAGVCGKLDATRQRPSCQALLAPKPASKAA